MKFSSIFGLGALLVGGVAAAGADLFSSMPSCALECMQKNMGKSSCEPTDIACLCTDEEFSALTQACLAQSCVVKDMLTSVNATMVACGVPPKDIHATLEGVALAFGITSLILVTLRVLSRVFFLKSGLQLDDIFIIIAMVILCVTTGVCVTMAENGMGRDFWSVHFHELYVTFKMLYLAEIFYMVGEMFAQLSILAFYMRIFPESVTGLRTASYILGAVVIMFGIANTACMIWQCTPIPYFWTSWTGETQGSCFDITLFSWIRAAVEIALDVAILALPLRDLWKLQMNLKKKMQVIGLFALGFIITIVSILRLQYILQFSTTSNPTYDNTLGLCWSLIENNMLIICASLPAARSFIMHLIRGNKTPTPSYANSSGRMYMRQDDSKAQASHQMKSFGVSTAGGTTLNGESDEDLVDKRSGKWSST